MSAVIQVTPEYLEQKAAEMRLLSEKHAAVMASIKSQINNLSDAWEGDAHEEFVQKYAGMDPEVQRFEEMLLGFSEKLNLAARTMREADESLTETVRTVTKE